MVWNNRTIMGNPRLQKEEKVQKTFRRWFSQFYTENSPRLGDKKDCLDWWITFTKIYSGQNENSERFWGNFFIGGKDASVRVRFTQLNARNRHCLYWQCSSHLADLLRVRIRDVLCDMVSTLIQLHFAIGCSSYQEKKPKPVHIVVTQHYISVWLRSCMPHYELFASSRCYWESAMANSESSTNKTQKHVDVKL